MPTCGSTCGLRDFHCGKKATHILALLGRQTLWQGKQGAKFQWSLIKLRWHWAGPSLDWSPLGLVAHIKKTQNFLIFIRFEKSLLNLRSYIKEGGVLYLTWFYSMKIIWQGSSSSPFPGYVQWTWCNLLPSPPPCLPQTPRTRGSHSSSSLLFCINCALCFGL